MQSKIIALGIILICVNSAFAWTDETAPYDNETLDHGFNIALNESTANNPYMFGMDSDVMESQFLAPCYSSLDPVTIGFSYIIYKQIWDGTNYIQIDNCNITIDTSVDLTYNPNTEMYELPSNWNQVTSNGFMVKKYFQELINSDSQYCNQWNSSDNEFPDVFYTTIEVDASSGETQSGYIYTKLSDNDIESLTSSTDDYGFVSTGKGSDGGSGGIYEGIHMYGTGEGDGAGVGGAFNTLFYLIIPLIFILAICKFVFGLV